MLSRCSSRKALLKGLTILLMFIAALIVVALRIKLPVEDKLKYLIEDKRTFWFSDFEIVHQPNYSDPAMETVNHQTTVISIYFELTKSKHSIEDYNTWINDMTNSIKAPMTIILSHKDYEKFRKLRAHTTTKFYVMEDIWLIMKELEFERNQSYLQSTVQDQNNIDPEHFRHNANLYAIWNLKSYFCYKISQENPFDSTFFIYTDAGAWRQGVIANWPDSDFISNSLLNHLDNRILFGQVNKFKFFDEMTDIIEGTFFAGSRRALEQFYANFFNIYDERSQKGLFVGKDQTTMNLLAFKYFSHTVVRLAAWNLNCSIKHDSWRFYQYYFSDNSTLHCTRDRLSLLIEL
jgi:hypothetical protein